MCIRDGIKGQRWHFEYLTRRGKSFVVSKSGIRFFYRIFKIQNIGVLKNDVRNRNFS